MEDEKVHVGGFEDKPSRSGRRPRHNWHAQEETRHHHSSVDAEEASYHWRPSRYKNGQDEPQSSHAQTADCEG